MSISSCTIIAQSCGDSLVIGAIGAIQTPSVAFDHIRANPANEGRIDHRTQMAVVYKRKGGREFLVGMLFSIYQHCPFPNNTQVVL